MSVADPAAPAESIKAAGRVQAWTAGPGMGTGEDSAALLAAVLATSLPVLVDADGITILAAHRELLDRSAPTLITPALGRTGPAAPARTSTTSRRGGWSTRPGRPTTWASRCCSRARPRSSREPGEQPVLVNSTGSSLAGDGRLGRRPVRAGGRAARPGHRRPAGRRGCGLPARHGRPPGRAGRAHRRSDLITALPAAIRAVTKRCLINDWNGTSAPGGGPLARGTGVSAGSARGTGTRPAVPTLPGQRRVSGRGPRSP